MVGNIYRQNDNYIPCDVSIISTGDQALLCVFIENDEDYWVPYSVIQEDKDDIDPNTTHELNIKRWWLIKRGIL